ncbi:hypothetical protein ACFE04_022494 [Oxalis oulophora]
MAYKLHQWLFNETIFPFNFIISFSGIIIIILLSLVYLYKKRLNDDEKFKINNLPPSPPKLPIIGNLHQIGKLLHRNLQALSAKYGPLMILQLGSFPVLIVSSADIVEEIIKQQDVIFSGRPTKKSGELLTHGITLSQYNNHWRFAKKICAFQLLSVRKVQAFHFAREDETGRVMDKIKLACRNQSIVNLREVFIALNSAIIARSTFGRVLNFSCESVAKFVKEALHNTIGLWVGDLFPYLGWIDVLIGNTRSLNYYLRELHTFIDQVIQDHQDMKPDESEEKDFVDILLDVSHDPTADIRFTRDNIKAILLDMFMAGTETSATVLEWAMAELMKNPSKMRKVQEEVRRVVGQKSKVSENDVNEMKYLKLVIKETLRLHPPFLIPRGTTESTVLSGYNIPSNIHVLINIWAIQRDPKLWDKPDEFYPERFAPIDVDVKGSRSHIVPFGFGRRICPGITHGNVVMEYVLANFLYWFDWKLPCGSSLEDFDMNDSYETVITKRKPLLLVPQSW